MAQQRNVEGPPPASGPILDRDPLPQLASDGPVLAFGPVFAARAGWLASRYRASRQFRLAFDECDAACRHHVGWSLVEEFVGRRAPTRTSLYQASAHALVAATQIACLGDLRASGTRPAAVVGHCAGELAGLVAAGAMTIDDLFRVISAIDAVMQSSDGAVPVRYWVVGLPARAALLISDRLAGVEVASDFGQARCVLSVRSDVGEDQLRQAVGGVPCAPARDSGLEFPWHTAAIEHARNLLLERIGHLPSVPPAIPYFAASAAGRWEGTADPEYWWRLHRRPSYRSEADAAALGAGYRRFVEVGPGAQAMTSVVVTARHLDVRIDRIIPHPLQQGQPRPVALLRKTVGRVLRWAKRTVRPRASPR